MDVKTIASLKNQHKFYIFTTDEETAPPSLGYGMIRRLENGKWEVSLYKSRFSFSESVSEMISKMEHQTFKYIEVHDEFDECVNDFLEFWYEDYKTHDDIENTIVYIGKCEELELIVKYDDPRFRFVVPYKEYDE